jgi:hypothetical protein
VLVGGDGLTLTAGHGWAPLPSRPWHRPWAWWSSDAPRSRPIRPYPPR